MMGYTSFASRAGQVPLLTHVAGESRRLGAALARVIQRTLAKTQTIAPIFLVRPLPLSVGSVHHHVDDSVRDPCCLEGDDAFGGEIEVGRFGSLDL